MAEKKKHTIVSASSGNVMSDAEKKEAAEKAKNYKAARPVGNATGLRIGAIILWVLAIGFEVLAIFELLKGMPVLPFFSTLVWAIIAIALDLICVVIGSNLWKKANHIKPASEKNKFLFWLYNNLGVIVTIAAFLPLIILTLTDKKSDKKTKTIAVVVAIVALLIGGFASYDYNPVSQEELASAQDLLGDSMVYWSPYGKVYHTHEDCQALNQSDTLTFGTVDEAIAASKTRLCKYCAKRDDITTLTTDGTVDDGEKLENSTPSVVYWADGADGYHLDPDCSALDEFENLVSGSLDEAADAGHADACPICGK